MALKGDAAAEMSKDQLSRERLAGVDSSSRENGAAGKHRHSKGGFLAQNQLYDCEHIVFNPWNCLPKHMLGSVNRMRLAVYLASLQARRKLNLVAS